MVHDHDNDYFHVATYASSRRGTPRYGGLAGSCGRRTVLWKRYSTSDQCSVLVSNIYRGEDEGSNSTFSKVSRQDEGSNSTFQKFPAKTRGLPAISHHTPAMLNHTCHAGRSRPNGNIRKLGDFGDYYVRMYILLPRVLQKFRCPLEVLWK
jgi:hypothetical protein